MKRRNFTKILSSTIFGMGLGTELIAKNERIPKKNIKPLRLNEGDTIGLISPSSPIPESRYAKAISNIESLGFKVKVGKHILNRNGYLAGTDEQRLEDIHCMFEDNEVKGIWCMRGGYGATRILDRINYHLIKENPKVFIGYSDITALLQAFHQKTGLICFHGPVANSEFTPYTLGHVKNILMNPTDTYEIKGCSENYEEQTRPGFFTSIITKGKARGILTGGNLSLIAAMTGTDYEWITKKRLLFLEDLEEKPYKIDRMLTQLKMTGELHRANGIILGIFDKCQPTNPDESLSLIDMFKDRLQDLNIPTIYGMSFGHINNQFTIPIGIEAEMDVESNTLTLLESAVL